MVPSVSRKRVKWMCVNGKIAMLLLKEDNQNSSRNMANILCFFFIYFFPHFKITLYIIAYNKFRFRVYM